MKDERIYFSDIFSEFIPDYECMLIPIQKYSNQEIMAGENDLAILMLFDKLNNLSDFKKLVEEVSPEYFAQVTENTSQTIKDIMVSVVRVLLSRLKLSEEEIDNFMRQIEREDNVGGWFEHFEEFDFPAARRKMQEEVREEVRKELQEEVRKEVQEEVRKEVQEEVRKEVQEEVRKEVQEEEYKIFIETFKELNVDDEMIIRKLVEKFSLTVKDAEERMKL